MDKTAIDELVRTGTNLGTKLLGALAVWIIGRWIINFGLRVLVARLERRKVDHTIVGYARNTLAVALNIALVVVLMGVLGIETTSFAAFIAGAGLAIGAAWSGLLSNFAAGAFLVLLRPFKTGDFISAGGVMGTVTEIGLFVTTVNTLDNVRCYVGNSKILAGNLRNFTANPYRRVDLSGTVRHATKVDKTMAAVRARLLKVPNVLQTPPPEVNILSFDEGCCTLAVRPFAHNDNYWQVYFDSTEALRGLLDSVGAHHGALSHEEGEDEALEGAEAEEGAAEGGEEGGEGAAAGEKAESAGEPAAEAEEK
jgi:small conductance mechanosensitive channel